MVQPVSVAKVAGSSVLLPCVVTGYPVPHIRWMFGDKLLEERYDLLLQSGFYHLLFYWFSVLSNDTDIKLNC